MINTTFNPTMKKTIIIAILAGLILPSGSLKAQYLDSLNLSDWGKYEDLKSEALQRIDQYRKDDAHLQVLLPGDRPASNATLKVELKRHEFLWGAVVTESFAIGSYKDKYREIMLEYFNASGFGVALKPKFRGSTREANTEQYSMPWFIENDFYVRGHTLTWEGYNYLRPEDKAIYDDNSLSDPEKGDSLLSSMGKHFPHAIPKWDVKCWDVSNEPMSNNLVNDLLPDYNTHVHWFKLADSIRKESGRDKLLLFQNDYQVISAISSWALGRPAKYRQVLDEQIALGAPITGIGFQSRLKHGLITPDTIYKRLCDFDRYNLPYHATEFEIRDDVERYVYTDQERRLLTEYMMVMYLSHPKVKGFWHWTFADQKSSVSLDYSLFNYDGSPKINGLIWMDLMDGVFNTELSLKAGDEGEGFVRGYYGSYELNATMGDSIFVGAFMIDSTLSDPVTVINMDRGFKFSGLEDSASYPQDEALSLELGAFSMQGNITSLGLYVNGVLIGSSEGASISISYTPGEEVEGWNEVIMVAQDELGNYFRSTLNVHFGDINPQIEILEQPSEPILDSSTGNRIVFSASSSYTSIDSVIVNYAGQEFVHTEDFSPFVYSLDGLPAADYQFLVRVTDKEGGQADENIPFSIIPDVNILPEVKITTPSDGSVFQAGEEISFSILASDEDGSIIRMEIFLNQALIIRVGASEHSFTLDTLSSGEHEIVARVKDNRDDYAHDTIRIEVEKELSAHAPKTGRPELYIYPNPVSDILYFSERCDFNLYSIQGQLVMEGKNADRADLSHISVGMYLVRTKETSFLLRKVSAQ